jgi:acid phosphatase
MPPLRSVTAASALICLCAIFFILWTYSTSDAAPPPPGQLAPGTDPAYGWEPFVASWTSWFQPGAWAGARYPAHNAGKISKDWNILYHLGGNGPWVQKIDGIVTNDLAPPEGCEIQQVHMVSRPYFRGRAAY